MTLGVIAMLLPQRWRKQLRLARTICLDEPAGFVRMTALYALMTGYSHAVTT
jgi:predicted protein tyrosine phosphatase